MTTYLRAQRRYEAIQAVARKRQALARGELPGPDTQPFSAQIFYAKLWARELQARERDVKRARQIGNQTSAERARLLCYEPLFESYSRTVSYVCPTGKHRGASAIGRETREAPKGRQRTEYRNHVPKNVRG
jgi:hypothetical protein